MLFSVNLFEHFKLLRRQVSLKVPQKVVEIKVVLCPRPKSDCSDVVIHRKVNEVHLGEPLDESQFLVFLVYFPNTQTTLELEILVT